MRNEVETVKAALKGDAEAFRCLVETYQGSVYTVVLSLVHDEHQAQDLAQETFIRAYLNLEGLKDPAKVGAWLCGIARNVARKWLTRHRPTESLEDYLEDGMTPPQAEIPLPDEQMEVQQRREQLWHAIYALPESYQEVLLLFYLRGMKRQEIADFLSITETAVRNRLHKARQSLKEVFTMFENAQLPDDFTDRVVAEAMKQGEAYLQQKSWQQAKQAFQRAADVQQDYAPAYRGIGLAARGEVLAQLDQSGKTLDQQLLEEAFTELSRAYRLGARDWDTVSTLGQLYEQFDRKKAAADIFENHAQHASEPAEAFRSLSESLRLQGYAKCASDAEIVQRHRRVVAEFADKVPTKDLFSMLWQGKSAYQRAKLIEEWLRETERIGLPIRDELWPHLWGIYTCDRCSVYAWDLKQRERAVEMAEEFLDYARNYPKLHPYRCVYMLDIYAMPLLNLYKNLEWTEKNPHWTEKFQSALVDIDSILDGYETEWHEMQRRVDAMSEVELRKWDALADYFNSGYEDKPYPVGGDKGTVRQWLDTVYPHAIETALHQIGCGLAWVGEGERGIRCFQRKQNQEGAVHNMFLAEWILTFRKDRDAALEYVRRAAQSRRAIASGYLKWRFFENGDGFKSVRNDLEFMAVVNATL
ncbi:sigma-70 family RNA polymerase sigma factor [Candidatus Poribacteria bacterium]|nr:sigma-70 family RNA polymerase sigma factor [Candidatus Poribacteria bacterium]